MAKIRHVYPGGNTCYGFHSFYDHIVPPDAYQKIILKGGPGTGKSTFMKSIAADLGTRGYDIEQHWCSSDNASLDAVVVGDQKVCLLDGTAPHVVDPRYPGAVDYIINLGEFWDPGAILPNKPEIISLTQEIGMQFQRAYNRLKEANCARWEWGSFVGAAVDSSVVNRNILALTDDFIHNAPKSKRPPRHLFAAALTAGGAVTKVESLIDDTWSVFAVKGSPGSGVKDLLKHIETMTGLNDVYAEIFHSPFDPSDLDLILIPASKSAILDVSSHIIDYERNLSLNQYKRILDFDQLLVPAELNTRNKGIEAAARRFAASLQEALSFIRNAKDRHDELEECYVPAMDFASLEEYRQTLVNRLMTNLATT
ncbi:MAG: hypothetical protein ABRQ24_06120 [Syntrophomonadaceae bacterium]